MLGYAPEARTKALRLIETSKDKDTRVGAAHALTVTGDLQKAQSVLDTLDRETKDMRFYQAIALPQLRAGIQLEKNQPADAIATLEPVRPYELGVGPRATGFATNYLRGLAYLRTKDGAKAAVEFQRILDHRGVGNSDPTYSLARLQLGRAFVLQADAAKAKTAYQDLFAYWKDADADLPVLLEARKEYEKLK